MAQQRIGGFVKDKASGEALIGASIVEPESKTGTISDQQGYFTLTVNGTTVDVSFIGYEPKTINVSGTNNVMQVLLEENMEQIEAVNIVHYRVKQFNTIQLSKKEIESIPAMGAKPDVLKILQLMPGIQPTLEGNSQIVVRGGGPGENLYLFDGVPVIYVNHLGGFISVFNPEIINHLEVFKGGFPAQYGGKLSSIVNITQREGDKSKPKGSLSIGATDASFVVEGPLSDKKGSFILTGRKSMYDPLIFTASALSGGGSFLLWSGFHDINAKVSWRPNAKNSYHFNLYQGDDYLRYRTKPSASKTDKSKQAHVWGNWLAAARWNRIVRSNLTTENILSYTRYRLTFYQQYLYKKEDGDEEILREKKSLVADVSLRSNWNWKISNNWNVQFGASTSIINFVPNKVINSTSNIVFEDDTALANETAAYLSNAFSLFNFIHANVGLRAVNYSAYGYSTLKVEPRVSLNIDVSANHTLNFSYQDVGQNAQLLLTSGSIMNNEMWIPAGNGIMPANAVQYQFGWKANWFDGLLQSEINWYEKELSDLSTYKEGYTSLLGDGAWRSKISSGGSGHSEGIEVYLKKQVGDWTGFMGYTYSNTTRQYQGINKGNKYAYEYDRPHCFSVNLGRIINDRWSVNATWVCQSGLPYTPALGQMLDADNNVVFVYGERNSARMQTYHRLDFGAKYKKTSKRGRRAEWTFSIYNIYSRQNAYFYYYDSQPRNFYEVRAHDAPIKLFKSAMFPIIPSASYKVYFDGENRRSKKNNTANKPSFKERLRRYLYYEN